MRTALMPDPPERGDPRSRIYTIPERIADGEYSDLPTLTEEDLENLEPIDLSQYIRECD